jgi:hypothetical protein
VKHAPYSPGPVNNITTSVSESHSITTEIGVPTMGVTTQSSPHARSLSTAISQRIFSLMKEIFQSPADIAVKDDEMNCLPQASQILFELIW